MGTKRPSGSIFDSLSGMIMSDRKHQPTGKTSRDPSPRLGMTERDRRREEEWQRDQEMDKRRDKARYKDSLDPRDRAYERDGAPVPRMREEDPARFREGERSRNGRPWSNVAVEPNREHEFKKCDTFPRMRKSTPERRREARNEERRYKTERRSEMGDQGRDFGRPRETYSDRQTDERRSRAKEDDRNFAGRNDMRRDKDFQDRSGRDAPRKGEKPRPDYEGKVVKRPSPQRRDDMDRRDRERRHRDTRSDGDSDERRERVRDKERIYQHSRSEGDSDYKTSRKPDYERPRYREEDGLGREDRRRDGDKRSERSREEDRRRERQEYGRTERVRRDERGDRREADTYKVQRQDREAQARDSDPRWGNQSGRVQEQGPRVPPRAQSSSEWSSDMDSDIRFRQGRDSYDESPERAVERGQEQQRRREIPAGERRDAPGNVNEQRRMWLEPKRDKMEKEDSRFRDRERQEESMLEGGNQQQVNKEPDESDKARDTGRERRARGSQTQGVSVDGEDVEEFCRELDSREHHSGSDAGMEGSQEQIDNSKESDREEGGSDYWPRSESEDGSDSDWRQERDRTVSGEDGFVTMSSGGDGEDEKEEEEEFVDCRDSWNSRDDSPSSAGDQRAAQMDEGVERDSRENKQKYIFCVIGQTLPRSKSGQTDLENPGTDTDYNMSSEPSEDTSDRQKQDANPHAEIGSMKRDSQTERLLIEWREKNMEALPPNPYSDSELNFEQILPALEGIDIEAMSPEEKEAIRIRMSGAWSLSEEPKRHSQAPHLKWAKDVIKEILGKSEEKTEDPNADSEASNRSEQGMTSESSADKAELGPEDSHSLSDDLQEELEDEELLELEGLRGMGQSLEDMHGSQVQAMHGERFGDVRADTPGYSNDDTLPDRGTPEVQVPATTEPSSHQDLVKVDIEVTDSDEVKSFDEKENGRQKEVEMYLSVSSTLYKPNSCPILNYESEFSGDESRVEEEQEESEEEPVVESDLGLEDGTELDGGENTEQEGEAMTRSHFSFRDLGPEARFRRRGIRKTERRSESLVEDEDGVGRDRRTRIFLPTDDVEPSKSWGEVELRNVLDTIGRKKRNSRFFNAAQLYQQYSEAVQNSEILRQSRSDVVSISEETSRSPAPSPPPANRPLPPVPTAPHPQWLPHHGSISSVRSLPLPEPPRGERRPSSPRLSIVSITQSATLWRDLPGVRNSTELEEISEDQRRLQEVRFEVVTSEASYCRSLDIVVEHFVKSKQLAALLSTQDKNWLFSRMADVRAISHSFLSKLEERLESDIMHFSVCDIIARHCKRFKMVYVPYLTNQSYQDATYQRLMNENPGFKRIVEKLERSPVCQRLPLRSFLVLPFQRITRIKLLVQNIVKRTTPGTPEAMQAIIALKQLEKLIQESNDSISQMKSIESLVNLSAKVDFECRTLPLINPNRRLVREGPVTELMDFSLKETERIVYLHLFNDYLLLSLQKEGGRFTVIDHAPVSELRVENCRVKLHSLQKNLFRLYMSSKSLLLRTDTQSDKLRWISALSRPHPEVDFSCAQDFTQMQCIRAFVAQQPDELSLEKADIILAHQQSSDHWVEGTRLSDRHRGWVPEAHLETITNARVLKRNLADALKLTTATAEA
ncbi:trichohyalin isoform X1 [Synchiropus splendidus]|uniref:trichohyalin isoform X1 n=1 Tax=Synchiropus splendidus TaxID=270530 RepID=UPI00237E592C|nr:trichohyalin isoform X1 [Synchiropus splendidus]